ncbi:MAG: hypothetical protein M1840_001891 [Geoglossum simile]|nr:MAG: hypothetical protein M1840_001891 [Geoglossum simile]
MEKHDRSSTPSSPKRHGRQQSLDERRRATPRRAVKGPLDTDEYVKARIRDRKIVKVLGSPLGAPVSPIPSPLPGTRQTPLSPSSPSHLSAEAAMGGVEHPARDFGYLLKPEIYHPLSQLEVPPPFRAPALQPPSSTPLPTLLSTGHFRRAAILSAHLLTTSTPPTAHTQIFHLLYVRLTTLTLINATPLAAQEVKALEDLSSSYYRDPLTNVHLVPWELRVLAVRLQGIGFGDWRRGIMGYYELAREARAEGGKTSGEEREVWRGRLRDLGVRVGNALVEMGDLEGAGRHLEGLREALEADEEGYREKLALLHLRIGNLPAAQSLFHSSPNTTSPLPALISMASGDFETAATLWSALTTKEPLGNNTLARQNLAICLLYTGKLSETRRILEELVDGGWAFHGLLWNLSTVYELCTERAVDLKGELAERVARGVEEGKVEEVGGERLNGDFKL